MKKSSFIFFLSLLLVGNTANAQFRKPLQSRNNTVGPSEALYNIGLVGGVTTTHWFHFAGTGTQYRQPFNISPTAGLSVERMLNSSSSIAIEGLYAMRNTQLSYEVLNFPVAINVNKNYYRQYNANYQEINIQVPYTYYFGQGNIRPYVYAAPRFSMPLSGKMTWVKKEILEYGTANQHYNESSLDTISMSGQNMRQWNVGIVAGAGVRFKINFSNYYLLLKLDASAHAAVINSFTKDEINGNSEIVVGASYIDPYLMQKRFNTDATVKLTLLFPLKKQLKGACLNWGEYD